METGMTPGMTHDQVKEYLTERIMKAFDEWMVGQTGPILSNGEFGYYKHDVERFADGVLLGKPTYWD
jgi:hypothetical protein